MSERDKEKEEEEKKYIIIKRINKGKHVHHGGAWKVAYADFVTAMMAFFLLMWLLAVTTRVQKEGIAEYFTPTTGVKDEMGIGFSGGRKQDPKGINRNDRATPAIVFGAPPAGPKPQSPEGVLAEEQKKGKLDVNLPDSETKNNSEEKIDLKETDAEKIEKELEEKRFQEIKQELTKAMDNTPALAKFKENLLIDETPEGLRIQITDAEKISMFELGSAILKQDIKDLLAVVTETIIKVPNKVSIIGHTDSLSYKDGANYTNWELSSDRANACRRFMMQSGFPLGRIAKVEGKADKEHLVKDDPESPRNRRISFILLKKSIAP